MKQPPSTPWNLSQLRQNLYSAAAADALDELGYPEQSPRIPLRALTVEGVLIGRAKTTLWEEIFELDPKPYELELAAVDGCAAGSVFIAAAGGSRRSGIWGELLTEAAARRGCAGAVVDGAVRDVVKMRRLGFPVYALGTAVHDSRNRQRIIAVDCAVELGGVRVDPDALIIADEDGLIVVPKAVEAEAIERALKKAAAENRVRDAIRGGLSAQEAWKRYGVL